jgi:hypothetical protein
MMLLTSGIGSCIEKKAFAPTLILIYSAIDTTGWLDSPEEFFSKDSFMCWVNNYLLKSKLLKCTAIDLYAARCGLLHTFTPNSKLSFSEKVRVISYAWGKAKVENMQRVMDYENKTNHSVVVHVEELYQAWLSGLALWGEDLDKDSDRSAKVLVKAAKFFVDVSAETLSDILLAIDNRQP